MKFCIDTKALLTDIAAELEITHADDMQGACCWDEPCEASKLLVRLAEALQRPELVPVPPKEERVKAQGVTQLQLGLGDS